MYAIRLDRQTGILDVKLSGMMSTGEVADYIAELKRQFVVNKLHDYAMVIDVSECPIQSQETVRAMGEHMATMPKARALAIVTGSSLARMQIRRLFTQPYARITATVAQGHAWVRDGAEPPAD